MLKLLSWVWDKKAESSCWNGAREHTETWANCIVSNEADCKHFGSKRLLQMSKKESKEKIVQ